MATHGGVGLAAPQVQLGKQLFVMQVEQNKLTPKLQPVPFTALFNPSWTPIGKSTYKSYESCLSVPGLWGMVERYEKIKVSSFFICSLFYLILKHFLLFILFFILFFFL